ncbi:hypothetical protein H8959_018461 [Pygathrix nigripes]
MPVIQPQSQKSPQVTPSPAAGPGRPGGGGGTERLPLGRSALAAPRGHGPASDLSPLRLSRDRRRGRGLTGSAGFGRVSSRGPGPQPGPWEDSGALGAASHGAGCGRPLAGAPRAHSPARGAGGGAHSASKRYALPAAGPRPGGRAGLHGSSRRALVLRCARGSPDGRGSFARCGLAAAGGTGRSDPRGERRQLAARGRYLHSAAPPRPARPAPPPGRDPPSHRPAPAPPVRGPGSGFTGGGHPAQGEASLHPAPSPPLRGRRPRPALALSLCEYTAHIAPGVYPGTQLPGEKGWRAREQRACAHLSTPLRAPPFPLAAGAPLVPCVGLEAQNP